MRYPIAGAAALLLTGCGLPQDHTNGTPIHETRNIPLDKTETVRLNLSMPVGELNVAGGSAQLMEGDFTFGSRQWEPNIDFRPGPSRGDLNISRREGVHTDMNCDCKWAFKFNDRVAMDVDANLGVGEARLNLGSMNLRSLDVHMGVGEVVLDLRGTPKRSFDVHIKGGVGQATVYLPSSVGIVASAFGGIGDISVHGLEKRGGYWINPAHEHDPVSIRVDAKGGIGEIMLSAE